MQRPWAVQASYCDQTLQPRTVNQRRVYDSGTCGSRPGPSRCLEVGWGVLLFRPAAQLPGQAGPSVGSGVVLAHGQPTSPWRPAMTHVSSDHRQRPGRMDGWGGSQQGLPRLK